jgi:hypothetical protein
VVSAPTTLGVDSGSERAALKSAAQDLARTPWPTPDPVSFAQRMTGFISDGDRMTRDRAVEIYIEKLNAGSAPNDALLADAADHLTRAKAVASVALIACESANPRMSDVAIVEQSIADLREIRSIYVSAYKELSADDDAIDGLKHRFDGALAELGAAADLLADTALKSRAKAFAGSADTL